MQHDNEKAEAENLDDGPTNALFNREIPHITL
jgi:hypothetical protein